MNYISTSCVSQVKVLAYSGKREGLKTTWNHFYLILIYGLSALNTAYINFHHMYHVWKLYVLTTLELTQTFVVSQLTYCKKIFMVLMTKRMEKYGVFCFIVSYYILKHLPWISCNESRWHSKLSAEMIHYQYSMPLTPALNCLFEKNSNFCDKEHDPNCKQPSLLLHLIISMLLIICGDVELNPGPKQGKNKV